MVAIIVLVTGLFVGCFLPIKTAAASVGPSEGVARIISTFLVNAAGDKASTRSVAAFLKSTITGRLSINKAVSPVDNDSAEEFEIVGAVAVPNRALDLDRIAVSIFTALKTSIARKMR